MTTFVVSYELRAPQRDYTRLWAELKRLRAHRALESLWLLTVTNTAAEVHHRLREFVDGNDALWVSELTRLHCYSNAEVGTDQCLARIPPAR